VEVSRLRELGVALVAAVATSAQASDDVSMVCCSGYDRNAGQTPAGAAGTELRQ
jgi:hypothetical protein